MSDLELLEQRFAKLEEKIATLNQGILNEVCSADNDKISRVYDNELQFQKINQKRSSLLNEIDSIMKRFVEYLSRDKSLTPSAFSKVLNDPLKLKKSLVNKLELRNKIKYFKYNQRDIQSFFKCKLNFMYLVIKNDWTIYKKFYFFSLVSPNTKTIRWPDRHNSYLFLNDDYYLIHIRTEFCLINKFFDLVKLVKLRSGYSIKSVHTVDSNKIVIQIQKDLSIFVHIFVFDFNLNLVNTKSLVTSRIKFCDTNFFYEYTPLLNNTSVMTNSDWIIKVFNYQLKQTDELNLEMFKGTIKQLLFIFGDKVIFKHHMDSDVTIRVANRANLNSSIKISLSNELDSDQFFVIKVERETFLYFFNIARFDDDSKLVICYDLEGKFRFKRVVPLVDQCFEIDFMNGETVRFNNSYDDNVVLF
jgi:hypothetical protein